METKWKDTNGNIHFGISIASKNGFDAIKCCYCEFTHIIPLPKENELDDYYSNIFYSDYKPNYMSQHKKDIEWWNQIFNKRKILFEQYLNSSDKRILDIGSGPGFFLKYFDDCGWETLGVEPGLAAAEYSRKMGLEIIQDSIYNLNVLNLKKFDVIHSNQTFEHLIDPYKTIEVIKGLLKPNGLLFVSVANDFNPIQILLNKKMDYPDWWFIPPEHINYFNHQSIESLLIKSNFNILNSETTFPIDLFLLMGDDYINKPNVGPQAHSRRKILENNFFKHQSDDLRKNIYNGFYNAQIGRESEVLAILNKK